MNQKIARLKKYPLIMDEHTLTWNYIHSDGTRAGNMVIAQGNIAQEAEALIREILKEPLSASEERELYTYVLSTAWDLCEQSRKMFANYSGIQELYNKGQAQVKKGLVRPNKFMSDFISEDYPYLAIASVQKIVVNQVKGALNPEVIFFNDGYQELTRQLAEAYNRMYLSEIKHYIHFCFCPSTSSINSAWDFYETVLQGLPQSVIETLDESGWDMALKDQTENQRRFKYKKEFEQKKEQHRKQQAEQEQEWLSRAALSEGSADSSELAAEMSPEEESFRRELASLKELAREQTAAVDQLNRQLASQENMLGKEGRKIFGRAKADNLEALKTQIKKTREDLLTANDRLAETQKSISLKTRELEQSAES